MLIREAPQPLKQNLFINNRSCVRVKPRNSARCPPIFNYGHSTDKIDLRAWRTALARRREPAAWNKAVAFARTRLSRLSLSWPSNISPQLCFRFALSFVCVLAHKS
jgi:hypothetical protein